MASGTDLADKQSAKAVNLKFKAHRAKFKAKCAALGCKIRSRAKYLLRAVNFAERLAVYAVRGRIRLRRGIFSAAWRKIFKRGLGATSAESAANGKITDKIAFKSRKNNDLVALMRAVFQTASAQLGLRFKPQACILRQSHLKQP